MVFITVERCPLSRSQSVLLWMGRHRGVETEPGYAPLRAASPPAAPSAQQVPFVEMISGSAPPAGHCLRGTESTAINCY